MASRPMGNPVGSDNEDGEYADGMAFLARSDGDPHQFRFIISPEDSTARPS